MINFQSVTNYFIANLALADVIIGVFAIPFQFQAALLQTWEHLPDLLCPFCPFFQVITNFLKNFWYFSAFVSFDSTHRTLLGIFMIEGRRILMEENWLDRL